MWVTREDPHPYFLWRPRDFNISAYFFATKSLNDKSSLQWTWPGLKNIRFHPGFQFFTDGGKRDDVTASVAWVISIIIYGGFKLARHVFFSCWAEIPLTLKQSRWSWPWNTGRLSASLRHIGNPLHWPRLDLRQRLYQSIPIISCTRLGGCLKVLVRILWLLGKWPDSRAVMWY